MLFAWFSVCLKASNKHTFATPGRTSNLHVFSVLVTSVTFINSFLLRMTRTRSVEGIVVWGGNPPWCLYLCCTVAPLLPPYQCALTHQTLCSCIFKRRFKNPPVNCQHLSTISPGRCDGHSPKSLEALFVQHRLRRRSEPPGSITPSLEFSCHPA